MSLLIWGIEIIRVDGNLFAYTRIQNEFTGNISSHFRRIYKDKNGYYAKADGKNNYLNGEVESFLKHEAYQKEAMDFFKKYKSRIYV